MVLNYFRKMAQDRKARAARRRKFVPTLEVLEERAVPSNNKTLGDIFYIEMENHNLTQPTGLNGSPEQLLGNPAAPYLNSLMTPGDKAAKYTSYASAYYNAGYNEGLNIHPSEPNYVWQEAGLAGPLNDADPYPNNIVNAQNLSALLQSAGIPWKSYQEDIDLVPANGTVNQPGANSLTSTVAPQNQWTVPLVRFSGTSAAYTNPYNGSNQYNFAPKHDGQLFFQATNGGDGFSPSNPEAPYYAPLQQLQTDLNNDTVASYNLITPDQYNDMHSYLNAGFTYQGTYYTGDQAAIAEGDNFLSIIVPQIMDSKAWKKNGAIVIWYDETEGGNTTDYTVPLVVVSRLAQGNAYDSTLPYTHSSGLKSIEELFGVYGSGGAFLGDANTPGTNDYSDLLAPGALQTSTPEKNGQQGTGSIGAGTQGRSDVIVTVTAITGASQAHIGLVSGVYTVTITPTHGLQNNVTPPTRTINEVTVGADATIRGSDSGFVGGKVTRVVGSSQDNLALGDLFRI
jgi:hypothetical protein